MKFTQFFSSDFEASSKRLIAIVLVAVDIVITFLLMYIKIEIANKDLVGKQLDNMFWLIMVFGAFIAGEGVLSFFKGKVQVQAAADVEKAKTGTPQNVVNQNVDEQNVTVVDKKEGEN
jgi:hypothetical protein